MSTIVTRAGKGSPLTHVEVDANFTNLNTDKVEKTAADITGGTINGTTIGATTPATGKFTTLEATGNTDLGTGSANYIDVSGGATTVAPVISAQGTDTNINLNLTAKGTGSVNLRTNTGTQLQVQDATGLTVDRPWLVRGGQVFALASVITGYAPRFQASSDESFAFNTNSGTSGAVGGSTQFQIAHTASAVNYVQVTGAATGGDPVVSAQGSDTNIDLALQPKGTGALQAQATTSTTAGGNARGANAVDWQTSRNAASQVASGSLVAIGGGFGNTASGIQGSIAGGTFGTITGTYNFIGGGISNTASNNYSLVVGGNANSALGIYNFIGGGFTNSGTANAAVTTQSGTMNATTAVTLSGSNANIKVGQYITGTSIATDTYVAAISGTSLTLSKVASGSSTSTLSFFTPHGVVVGGGNNQATGSYSFIGGGGDAGTAANRNTASGPWSAVVSGRNNIASGAGAFIGGGGYYEGLGATNNGNTASGDVSVVNGGILNQATGFASTIIGGQGNSANNSFGAVFGNYGSGRSINGNIVLSANVSPLGTFVAGSSQSALLVLARQTTDATATALTSNTAAATTNNQVILPNNSAYFFTGEVISGVTGGGNTKGWTIEGVIKRGANAASTALVGTPTVTSTYADAGASTWAIAVTADTTNGGIRVTFTGQAATTIRTVCQIRTTEMTY
jgi:hypothetical protein